MCTHAPAHKKGGILAVKGAPKVPGEVHKSVGNLAGLLGLGEVL